jgi:hypothetical protein
MFAPWLSCCAGLIQHFASNRSGVLGLCRSARSGYRSSSAAFAPSQAGRARARNMHFPTYGAPARTPIHQNLRADRHARTAPVCAIGNSCPVVGPHSMDAGLRRRWLSEALATLYIRVRHTDGDGFCSQGVRTAGACGAQVRRTGPSIPAFVAIVRLSPVHTSRHADALRSEGLKSPKGHGRPNPWRRAFFGLLVPLLPLDCRVARAGPSW